VTVGAQWMIVVSFMAAEHTTRRLARLNRTLAYSDPMTEIPNMRRLRERLGAALNKPDGIAKPFALFAIDLDNFKLVNDKYDHGTGDRVLRAVAEALTDTVDASDLVARRGGDEFSVFVSDPDERDLDALARRLAIAIGRARTRTCLQVTPSGCVAYVRSVEGDTIASVLQRADDALHDAKHAFHARYDKHDGAEVRVVSNLPDASPARSSRTASFDRVAAAVNRAYSPRRSAAGVDMERRIDALRRWWSELNPLWSFSAVALPPAGFSLIFLTLAGLLHPLPLVVGVVSGSGFFILAGCGIWASGHGWPVRIMHLGFIWATLLTVWATYAAGSSGAALIDIFPVLALYAIFFLGPREALPYLVALMAVYSTFAIAGGYAYGTLRAGITATVVLAAAALVTKVRAVTVRFARTNAELSEVDPLTGLANTRALGFRVADAIERASRASRAGTRPSILTVDLDKFKLVNDRYSHSVGDQVIESVARAIAETVRADELVARRGGDEFFVLFEHTGQDQVGSVIDRLYAAIQHTRLRLCPDLPSSASIGIVAWREGESADDFLHRADLAMHDEKLSTRARADRQSA
jgi:diguanylate cyclase (GGDEF)-like protein